MDGVPSKGLDVPTVTIIGCVQADVVMSPVTDLPAPGGTLLTEQMTVRVGGAGANAALASVEAGIEVRLIGCIGEDQLGGWMRDQLTLAGLADELVAIAGRDDRAHGRARVPGRDRTFLTYLGVNARWEPAMIPDDALTCENLLLCDYFVAPRLRGEAAAAAPRYRTRPWRPHVLRHQLGPRRLLREARAEVRALLPSVDVFLPNEVEACALAGSGRRRGAGGARPAGRLGRLGGRQAWTVRMSRGRAGGDETAVPAPAVPVGRHHRAGDAFNAGLVQRARQRGELARGADDGHAVRHDDHLPALRTDTVALTG